MVTVEPVLETITPQTSTFRIRWNTSSLLGAQYLVYHVERPPDRSPCGSLGNATDCILHSECGLVANAIPREGGYELIAPDTIAERFIDNMENKKMYYFNVAMLTRDGVPAVYSGAEGDSEFIRVEAAVSPFVQNVVGGIAGFIGLVLLGLMAYAKVRDNRSIVGLNVRGGLV